MNSVQRIAMTTLAWKNLLHDKVRLAVTLSGIIFALVLIIVQFGLFLGFLETSANVVQYAGADLWVLAKGTPHAQGASVIPERWRYKIMGVDGVRQVSKHNIWFTNWKLPSGATESVTLVGFDLRSGMGGPWNLVAGSVEALAGEDTVIIDELYLKKLGVRGMGDHVEILGRRARIVGLTRGIRSFTTAPYIFCSFKNSQNYAGQQVFDTLYFLVRLQPGADSTTAKSQIQAQLPGSEVLTNTEFWLRARNYWVFETGAGITTLMGSVLGLLVGIVVVAQTIYSATVDHIREFGTLKAVGASNGYIYRVIIEQALLSAVLGYSFAIVIGWMVVKASDAGNAAILLPPWMVLATFVLAVGMCVLASVISIRKATTIDPALVFRG
jgi:putative ABC transport system permease protein